MTDTPLRGLKIVEFGSIGPVPHAAMLLSDLGADTVRIGRGGANDSPLGDYGSPGHVLRGRTFVTADLKDERTRSLALDLLTEADVVLEGFRPGVMERLGLGPDVVRERNRRLVYARMTGWGQDGPLARTAGHDINYVALTGALNAIGPKEQPLPPLSLVGDYAGGSMFLVFGVLSALYQRERTKEGTVVDASIVDGVSALVQPILELRSQGLWSDERADNMADGAAPYYRTYRCQDGGFMAVGAVEERFYELFVRMLDLVPSELPDRAEKKNWGALTEIFQDRFLTRPREEWTELFTGTDACVTPVLTFEEAPLDPHVRARGSLYADNGDVTAAPAPRFAGKRSPAASGERVMTIEAAVARWRKDPAPFELR